MNEGQQYSFSDLVSNQPNGIVLVWSHYESGAAKDYNFIYTFVPKLHTQLFNGCGVICSDASFGMSKYVYIHDDKIVGHTRNDNSATTDSGTGLTYTNSRFVLRYVIGV